MMGEQAKQANGFILTTEMQMVMISLAAGRNILITGGAGVGKSTLIKHIKDQGNNMVFLAPTGLVANSGVVQGKTIHSFFKLPISKPFPDYWVTKISHYNVDILRRANVVVIDEASMVRSDILQTVDNTMRDKLGVDKPFGGKQMILVGDFYQLPPIAAGPELRFIKDMYGSKFCFATDAWKDGKFAIHELTRIFRQTDAEFIDILNAIKIGTFTDQQLQKINATKNNDVEDGIILTTKNNVVDRYNSSELDMIWDEEEETYTATVEGDINERGVRAPLRLTLKKGCKIMCLVNDMDGSYHNGSLGTYVGYNEKEGCITVCIKGVNTNVHQYSFENFVYEYNEKEAKITKKVLGVVRQYPIKLGYAISVHKSQGMTFERVKFDVGGGAFDTGQVYVALSRCTTLEGLQVKTPISRHDIMVSKEINDFFEKNRTIPNK